MKKDCCKAESNLGPELRYEGASDSETYRVCQVCGCRHFSVVIEPMVIGIRGAK